MGFLELRSARILVVDDDAYAVRALRNVLEQVGASVESAMSVRAALDVLRKAAPLDAAVVDFFLVGHCGHSLVRPLREQLVSTLMISGVERVEVVNQAISAGADDFMLKPFEIDEFLACVARLVSKTRLWRQKLSEIRHGIRPEKRDRASGALDEEIDQVVGILSGHSGLTERETRVVRLVAHSLTSDQIAARLGISVSTVKYHDKKAREKLGVDSRDELRQVIMRLLGGRRATDV